jgi:hypothetical protein
MIVGALLAATFIAGSAWADEASVVQAVTEFGLARMDGETGNTITIVNASGNPLRKDVSSLTEDDCLLDLGDITGITIDWKANLTVTGEMNIGPDDGIDVVRFENGAFNLAGGTIDIQTTGTGVTNVIQSVKNSTVTVNGATLRGTGLSIGIFAESSSTNTKVIVERGALNFPNGVAILATQLTVNNPSVITGMTCVTDGHDINNSIDIYGNTYTEPPFDPMDEYSTFVFTVKDGATWTVKPTAFKPALDIPGTKITLLTEGNGKLILSGEGVMDIYGTLTNKGSLVNHGTIKNHSKNTLNNEGTLTNNGTIENAADAQITNTGTIDNAGGKIVNDGAIDNTSGTIKSDAANYSGNDPTGNQLESINNNTNNNGSGGGCNAGFGMFGLLLAGLAARKHRL